MNDERYIIARFKATILQRLAEQKKIDKYTHLSAEEALNILMAIEATTALDMEVDEILDPKVPLVEEAENA